MYDVTVIFCVLIAHGDPAIDDHSKKSSFLCHAVVLGCSLSCDITPIKLRTSLGLLPETEKARFTQKWCMQTGIE